MASLILAVGPSAGAWIVVPAARVGQEVDAEVALRIARELEAQGAPVLDGREAARLFRERASSEVAPVEADLVAEVERVVDELLVHVAAGQGRQARRDVARLEELVAPSRDALERDERAARALQNGCLHAARALLDQRDGTGAREQARRCIGMFPGIEPDIRQHPPEIFGLISEVRAEMLVETLGTLRVESEREGCAVFLNGHLAGRTPAEIERLIPGEYRVQVECAGQPAGSARLHRVVVPAQRRLLVVDTRLDRAVRTSLALALSYPSAAEEDARRVTDARAIADILQAAPVVLVTRVDAARYRLDRLHAGSSHVIASVIVGVAGVDRVPAAIQALRRRESRAFDVDPPAAIAPWRRGAAREAAPIRAPASPAAARPARAARAEPAEHGQGADWSRGFGYSLGVGGILALGGGWIAWAEPEVEVGPIVGAAVGGGLLLAIAEPLALGREDGVPWWGWTVGVVGVGLGVWGAVLAAVHGRCTRRFSSGACRIETRSADAGALLLGAAVPLLEVPLLYALRSTGAPLGAHAFLDLRERGAVLGAGGVF